MAEPTKIPREELERMRDLGAVAYHSAYIHLMAHELGVDVSDTEFISDMVVRMIEPMNLATEAIWRAMMNDHSGEIEKVLERFRESLDNI